MIDFTIILLLFAYILLTIGFVKNDFVIAVIAAFLIAYLGIHIAINGIGDVNNFLTQSFAVINFGISFYVIFRGSVEQIQNATGDK